MPDLVPVAPSLSFAEIERLGANIARSGLFGIKTAEQAVTLMMIAHAEGRHPALAARDYDIIGGRPAKKAEAMLRDFVDAGGKVQWHALTDELADATFSHPQGGAVRISWDMARVQKAGLKGKDMYAKFPRQMLRSRLVSEGVRTIWPSATGGMYVPEEAVHIEAQAEPTRREQINADVPLVQQAAKPSLRSWLDSFEAECGAAASRDEAEVILKREEVVNAGSVFAAYPAAVETIERVRQAMIDRLWGALPGEQEAAG